MRLLFRLLVLMSITGLLCSALAGYVSPQLLWPMAFMALTFPFWLILNALIIVLSIISRDWWGVLSLASCAICWPLLLLNLQFNNKPASSENGIRVLSWNVQAFDINNYTTGEQLRNEMRSVVQTENPDIICFQEFHNNNHNANMVDTFTKQMDYPYHYFLPVVETHRKAVTPRQKKLWPKGYAHRQWGVALFSKFPIVDSGRITFNNSYANGCMYADIRIQDEIVRFYNMHLQSINLNYDDYRTLQQTEVPDDTEWKKLKAIAGKMKRAYQKRALQAKIVREHADVSGMKTFICGDFNDVPHSYVTTTLRNGHKDSFVEKGVFFGGTYTGFLSLLRIDYVLIPSDCTVNTHRVIRKKLSDHYPVSVSLQL